MQRSPFRVLFREFLFRIVDLEILASRGDLTKLLGQLAALVAAISLIVAGGARRFAESNIADADVVIAAWPMIHFLIATTMLMVGLFTILSWDSMFPDRRDALVLGPLPLRAGTMFAAKLAALGAALGLTILLGNTFTGLSYPAVLGARIGGFFGFLRIFAAYWLTMIAAGSFILGSVLAVQGIAAQLLPRRHFLRLSGFLQLAAFCLLISVYFLQPPIAAPGPLTDPRNQALLSRLPSYWFLGLFGQLSGEMHPALAPLARRAVLGWALVIAGATVAFLLSYFRTLQKIVDEPDIVPGASGKSWRLPFSDSLQAAIVGFSIRSMLRSRQHRVILALYLGIGGAIALACARAVLYGRARHHWNSMDGPLLIGSIIVLCFSMIGVRVVFTMPIALKANWTFRITTIRPTADYLKALRRALLVLAAFPIWVAAAALFVTIWPLPQAAGHLIVLVLLGEILADFCVHGLRKIPFTCSYLPGKANIHLAFGASALLLVILTDIFAIIEKNALQDPVRYLKLLAFLALVKFWTHRRNARPHLFPELVFEESPLQEINALELHRDGAIVR